VARLIAEIGSNHNRDQDRCLALIDAAAAAGCDAVKLQVFRVDDLFAPEALASHPELGERRAWEFPLDLLPAVRARCYERGIELGATPFALWAVDALAADVDFFKVASYELLWHDLLRACAATGSPLLLSTGMADEAEVGAALAAVGNADVTLLHCISAYPAPAEQVNLAAIASLRHRFGRPVGWSDHSADEEVVVRAVARWGASDVELHIDLDGEGAEAGEHNWSPERISRLAARLEATGEADLPPEAPVDGDGRKRPQPAEEHDVPWRADPSDGLRPLRAVRSTL
jgi:N-acetylneuraminate synthase